MNLTLIMKMAWRDWRSGELGLLLVALMVAVGTVTAVSLFVDRLQQALITEAADFLAADRVIGSSLPIPDDFLAAASRRGIEHTQTLVFPSMIYTGNANSQLVSVKAVAPGYPLRGVLRISDEPFTSGTVIRDIPEPGHVWIDGRLFPALGIELGQHIEVGVARLEVSRVLISEPDRGGSLFDLGPRVLMHIDDVPATEVVQPGSRISYRLLLRGPDKALAQLKEELPLAPNFRWQGIRQSSPTIGSALDRAESFLLLAALLGVLLAGVAVALSAHRYARRHYDHVGVLKTLGATPNQILWAFLGALLVIGIVAVVLGLGFGTAVHFAIVMLLNTLIPVVLPAPTVRPFMLGTTTGLICALAFALPPLLHLKGISPMRVIRRDLGAAPPSQVLTYGGAIVGSLVLLVWYSGSLWLTIWTLLTSAVVMLVFGALAYVLLGSGRVIGMQAGSAWRLAMAGLQRRRKENVAQILIFGLAIMLLLILVLLRTSLLDEWRAQVPENAPNHFVMNIMSEEVEPLRHLLAGNTERQGDLFPMIRGRTVAVNGIPARQWERQRRAYDTPGPGLRSERNLTWSNTLPEGNEVIAGQWWGAAEAPVTPDTAPASVPASVSGSVSGSASGSVSGSGSGSARRAAVSVEEGYAAAGGLSLGDEMTFDIGGSTVEADVVSIRRVEWESMRPNFFIIFAPASLEDYPATYMTSFYLRPERKMLLNELLSRFPTVTVIEVDAIIAQVQSIISRVTQAVELVMGLVLAAGCLVLTASIQASRDARMREHALLRALGGSRRLIRRSLTVEFAVLGVFAGIVAAVGAQLTVSVLQARIFELSTFIHPWLWVAGPVGGGLLILLVGLFGTRNLVSTPPIVVLRGLN